MKFKSVFKLSMLLVGSMMAANAVAAPNTEPAKIKLLRPYANGTMFVQMNTTTLTDGGTCSSVYRVQNDQPGAKAVIATLLTAYALESDVEIELPTSTGCTGFGTPIQSVYLR